MSPLASDNTLEQIKSSKLADLLLHILSDTIVTIALLLALSLTHYVLHISLASEEFKHFFESFHELVFLGTYGLLACKGMYRVIKA